MERLLKLAGIFVGLTVLVFLGILVAFQTITLPHSVTDSESGRTLSLRATTSPIVDIPQSSSSTVVAPIKKTTTLTPPAKSAVSAPGPLIVTHSNTATTSSGGNGVQDENGALNQKDITTLTNIERVKEGLRSLVFNKRLALMAEAKARDMIDKQYFAHVSPNGTDATKLALNANYQYLNLGENLAMGDFRSSAEVVTGWMNSPGHRANILNKNFTEIGVAAILGNYKGRMVWYSVQEFGRPLPDCTKPDAALEQKIELAQTEITKTETTLANLRSEIDTPNIDQETYNTKANMYNALVPLYNDLVANLKADIESYNTGVKAYNACINAAA